jgi:hypothetical protein
MRNAAILMFAVVLGLMIFAGSGAGYAAGLLPAFPGAEGDGALAQGGRGGKVLIVDRLDDPCVGECTTEDLNDPAKLVPGTLRWALLQPYPRTVVFRVAGTIALQEFKLQNTAYGYDYTRNTTIRVTSPYLTVAGQTAPAGGITVRNAGIAIETHDVVLRYLRLRTGRNRDLAIPNQQNPETLMVGEGAHDVIIDHCSVSWMPAEGVSVYGMGHADLTDVTLSWNLIGEALIQDDKGLGHPGGGFMAGFEGDHAPERVSFHHNLLLHSQKRNADFLIKSGSLINNIIYNWQWLPTVIAGGIKMDIVGNIWKPGPQTSPDELSRRSIHLVPAAVDRPEYDPTDPNAWWNAVSGSPILYLKGNLDKGRADRQASDWELVCHYTTNKTAHCLDGQIAVAWKSAKPVAASKIPVTVQDAEKLEAVLQASVGASQRLGVDGEWLDGRDMVDQRFLEEYRTGTYLNEKFPWHEDQVGGFPVPAKTAEPYPDADKDGMADDWEKRFGLNPADSSDAASDHNGDGYTNLEAFLNGITP